MRPTAFSAAGRADVVERVAARSYDLLVIGGGITGAGVALDAAARGLKVALVERDDLASGTSSKSSKLVHGGIRYLQQGDLAVVRESVAERERLQKLAPHLVQRQPFAVPDRDRKEAALFGAALTMYGGLGGFRSVTKSKRLSAEELQARLPGLRYPVEYGGWEYSDCRTDDARLTLTVAKTAARLGADILTHAEVVELQTVDGAVTGATVRDRIGSADISVSARVTLSATGVWADGVRDLAGPNPLHLMPSKGVHLVFSADDIVVNSAAIITSGARDGRRLFVIPWGQQVVVGTTDDVYEGSIESPSVEQHDAEYVCHAVNRAFELNLGPQDAVGAWAGLRPLPRGGAKPGSRTDTLSRRHALMTGPKGLITLTGGKLTTYRRMAADGVDAVMHELGGKAAPSPTAGIHLGMRGGFGAGVQRVHGVCRALGVDPDLAHGLVERHGDDTIDLLQMAADHGETDVVIDGLPYIRAELRWAIDQEMALTVDDVLRRRVRVALRHAAAGGPLAKDVGALLAERLGWDQAQARASVQDYRRKVTEERGVVPIRS